MNGTSILRKLRRGWDALMRDRRGSIMIQFALVAAPMTVLAFGLVDVNRASTGKKELQDALDAATLIAARSSAVTDADLQAVGSAALTGQLQGQLNDGTLASSTFTSDGPTVHGAATITVSPIVGNLWLAGDMSAGARSDVMRSVNKLEIALVLDNTGSMAGAKLTNLKLAATRSN